MSTELAPLLAIMGPTGSGKTEVGVELAKRLKTEIISADSVLIYRHFNIGSAKPEKTLLNAVTHHMIDVADPDEEFNVSSYQTMAKDIANRLWSHDRLPLVVGGSWLYVKGLTQGLALGVKISAPAQVRLDEIYSTIGQSGAHGMLGEIDPHWASKVHPNDTFRTQRGLGVFFTSGQTMTAIFKNTSQPPLFDSLLLALNPPRKLLYERIERRVAAMFDAGLRDEVGKLMTMGYNGSTKAMRSIGYREVYEELTGAGDPVETERLIRKGTKAYARRQLTWMRKTPEVKFIDTDKDDDPARICDRILSLPTVEEFLTRHHVGVMG